jgi:hypothetical protein
MRAHKKQRFGMGCNAGYFISTRHSSRLLAAFREPFLVATKLTDEVRATVTAQGPDGEKTTHKWEDNMVKAQVAWHVLEKKHNGRQNRIIREGSNKDKESKEEAIDLLETPLVYKWEDTHSIKEVSFKLAETEVKDVPTITELSAVVRDLSHKMKLMAKSFRHDALGLMDQLWKSIACLAKGIKLSNKSVRGMREDLGDITKLQGEHNVYDMIKGITLTLTSKPWEEEFMVLSDWVTAIANMLREVDKDHQAAGRLLLRKLNHQKQHYVPYYLSIVLILSIKHAFGIINMFFTLVRCSIVLLMFLLTYCIHVSYLMSKFIAFLNVFSCPTRNVPYGKSCLL